MSRIRSLAALCLLAATAACSGGSDARPSGPTAPSAPRAVLDPLSLVIDGPSPVQKFDDCFWFATASGGTAPYTYDWHINGGAGTVTGDTFEGHLNGSSMILKVKVTDALGAQDSTSRTILGSFSAPTCS
jgi:hypothetical protein